MLHFFIHSLKENGCAWVSRRLLYEAQVKSGVLARRFPARPWQEREAACSISNEAGPENHALFAAWKQSSACFWSDDASPDGSTTALHGVLGDDGLAALRDAADAVLAGRTTYFSDLAAETGFPPDWQLNPFTGGRVDDALHWSRQPMWSPEYGDIKYVWEPGRFAVAYLLGRAYRATGDERYANGFWELVHSFYEHNPPNTGPHWKCGQEMALRIMACCFGLHAVADSDATTPERFGRLIRIIATHADRIAANHVYAHLQQNNHAMSEGVGLFVAGVLFPFLRRAEKWSRQGQQILEKEARLLIRDDGTFNQKSHNYHRLMLQDYLYAMRVAETNGVEFSAEMRALVAKAVDYICQVLDRESGMTPNFGANDGALIVPLNNCDFTDFRPICQAGRYLLDRTRWLEAGPWDEDLYWLFGPKASGASRKPFKQCDLSTETGGCYTLRGESSWIFTHCESFTNRPSHADALHVDLWWRGLNIACDAGTYLYFAQPPWNNGLTGTAVHNTVTLDDVDQLNRGPRFMWTGWHDARAQRSGSGSIRIWAGEHEGYKRLPSPVAHRRTVTNPAPNVWVIADSLTGEGCHRATLHWLLADFAYDFDSDGATVKLSTSQGDYYVALLPVFSATKHTACSLVRADKEGTRGWISRRYGQREPALSLSLDVSANMPGRFITTFSGSPPTVDRKRGQILISEPEMQLTVQATIDRVSVTDSRQQTDIN
jgi:hypothetical protein